MRTAIIVQARMTSTRLPGKVLMDLAGAPMLLQQIRRLRRIEGAPEIVIATTTNHADDALVDLCRSEECSWFRGSEEDVLSRYLGAAHECRADLVVRVTSDCPLIEPEVVERVIVEARDNASECDYASNIIHRTYPRGLDVEAVFTAALERVGREAHSLPAREHVTYHILKERPDRFRIRSVVDSADNSDLRWTVDTGEDLELIRRIYQELELGVRWVPYRAVLSHVRSHPALMKINEHVAQKAN